MNNATAPQEGAPTPSGGKRDSVTAFLNSLDDLSLAQGPPAPTATPANATVQTPAPRPPAGKSNAARNVLMFLDEISTGAAPATPNRNGDAAAGSAVPAGPGKSVDTTPPRPPVANQRTPHQQTPLRQPPRENASKSASPNPQALRVAEPAASPRPVLPLQSAQSLPSTQPVPPAQPAQRVQLEAPNQKPLQPVTQQHQAAEQHAANGPAEQDAWGWSSWGSSFLNATQQTLAKATTTISNRDFIADAERLRQQVLHSVDRTNIERLIETSQSMASNLVETVAPPAASPTNAAAKQRRLMFVWLCVEGAENDDESELVRAVETLAEAVWQSETTNDGSPSPSLAARAIVHWVDPASAFSKSSNSVAPVIEQLGVLAAQQRARTSAIVRDYDQVLDAFIVCGQRSAAPLIGDEDAKFGVVELRIPRLFPDAPRASVFSAAGADPGSVVLRAATQTYSAQRYAASAGPDSILARFSAARARNAKVLAIEDLMEECRLLWNAATLSV